MHLIYRSPSYLSAVAGNKFVKQGEWDSIHVVEVRNEGAAKAHYKLTTTVMLNMGVDNTQVGDTNMCGSLTRQVQALYRCVFHNCVTLAFTQTELSSAVNETKTHLANIGRMIEDLESEMRMNLNQLYILKTREIVNSIRSMNEGPTQAASHVAVLNAAVSGHGKTRKTDSES